MTSFMDKHINLFLVLLLVFILLTFTGVTIFFQDTFDSLSSTTQSTLSNLSTCNESLNNYRQQLSLALTKVNTTEQDIEKWEALYTKKVDQLDEKEDEISDLEESLRLANFEKEKMQDLLEEERLERQRDARTYEAQIQSLQEDIADWRDQVEELEDQLDACGGGS